MAHDAVIDWLLSGDPAIRWQTLRDLAGRPHAREQGRVATEGWGSRLLALQDKDGRWSGGLYTPKWTSTTYTMLLLRDLGLAPCYPAIERVCRLLLDKGYWRDGGINFYVDRAARSETCITAMVLALSAWGGVKDERLAALARHLRDAQMADGGWNCRALPGGGGAAHGSFHTTILALEALREWDPRASGEMRALGEEFLLQHRLFRSHRTGKIAKTDFTRFHFPPRWHYDVLRGLDYFRAAGCARDSRLQDAIDLVHSRRQADGRWLLAPGYPGKMFFELERVGEASRWNTLRALRVLRWFEAERAE